MLFQNKHKTNKRKERDQSVERLSRKKAKKMVGVDVHTPTLSEEEIKREKEKL